MCSSGKWRDDFMATIKLGNESGWFVSPPLKVPEYELLHDVPMHWDLVYFMLNRLQVLRVVGVFVYILFFSLFHLRVCRP